MPEKVLYTRNSKYGARKVRFDGITFDSQIEGYRYLRLKDMEKRGEISDLRMQVKYELIPKQVDDPDLPVRKQRVLERSCDYLADFVYKDKNGVTHVEDTKGMKTKEYIIKRKLMLYVHGIKVEEINRRKA